MPTAKSAAQIIAGLVVFAAIFLMVRYYRSAESFDSNEDSLSISLEREAAELNATLPEMVSEGVRLDKAAAGPGNSFSYIYTIVDDEAAKKMAGDSRELVKIKAQLHERVCTTMPERRESGTIINYSLKDNKGAAIADFSINPKDC
jgi:hypothetical protein